MLRNYWAETICCVAYATHHVLFALVIMRTVERDQLRTRQVYVCCLRQLCTAEEELGLKSSIHRDSNQGREE